MRKLLLLLMLLVVLPVKAEVMSGSIEYYTEKDRKIGIFSDGSKGINYFKDPLRNWYYNSNGELIYIELKTKIDYPYRAFKYTPDGALVNVSVRLSDKESLIYDIKGNLIGHWIEDNCYDENGQIVMTREIIK